MAMVMAQSANPACRHVVCRRRTTELPSWWYSRRSPQPPTTTTTVIVLTKKPAARCSWALSSCLRDGGGGGGGREMVDEGMPVLWRRILEMKLAAAEREEEEFSWPEQPPPSEAYWDQVVDQYSVRQPPAEEYWRRGGDVESQLFHALRGFVLSSGGRPAVAVGIGVFLMLSVPAFVFLSVCSRALVEWQRLVFTLTEG